MKIIKIKDIKVYVKKDIYGNWFIFEAISAKRIFTTNNKLRRKFFSKNNLAARLNEINKLNNKWVTLQSLKKNITKIILK